MSEKKRFILAEDSNGLFSIFDNEDPEDEPLIYGARFGTEKIVDKLNEQQAIIDQLNLAIDDLLSHTSCEEIKKENEQLRENLHNCRFNKSIIREKLKLWQEVHKEYNIYSIKDFEELLNEQEQKIQKLESENDNMNLFIKQTIEPLLSDCVFELSTIESWSQVELAEKIENEIIPFIQDFKYLKYESLEEETQDKSKLGDNR